MAVEGLSEFQEQLDQSRKEFEVVRQQLIQRQKDAFGAFANQLFEQHPKLQSFGWRQYTPYFNDGDACTFSAYTDYPVINDVDEDYGHDGDEEKVDWTQVYSPTKYGPTGKTKVVKDWRGNELEQPEYGHLPNPDYDPEWGALVSDVKAFLRCFDEDALEQMFGDHVTVRVLRGGQVEIEDYDHD